MAIVAGVFLLCCGSMRPDELQCEEAAAYIDHCCPGQAFATGLNCTYIAPTGCCDEGDDDENSCGGHNPDLTESQSTCVRKIQCASLCNALTSGVTVAQVCGAS